MMVCNWSISLGESSVSAPSNSAATASGAEPPKNVRTTRRNAERLARALAYQAAASIKSGRLKIVLAKFEPPPLPIHIVYPTSRLLSAKVRTFIDLVTDISDWHFGGK